MPVKKRIVGYGLCTLYSNNTLRGQHQDGRGDGMDINPVIIGIVITVISVLVILIGFLGILLYKERREADKQSTTILKALLARNLHEFSISTADQNLELKKIVEENKLAKHASDLEKKDFDKRRVT